MRQDFIMVALLVLATATRLYHIDFQSIWFDEGWSAFAAVQPTLRAAFEADPTNPPLYYVLVNLTTRAFGDSAFGLRLASLIPGLLTIPLAYQLACRLFNRRAGLYAAFLVALSPPLWWASQEARMYTLLALLVLLMALAWHQLTLKPKRWAWLLLWLAELGLLYAHNTGPIVVVWINAVTVILWFLRHRLRRPDWRVWLAGQIVVSLLWLPWFLTRFLDVQSANSALVRRPALDLLFLSHLWQAFWISPWEMVGQEPVLLVFAVLALGIALILIPWRQGNARWLVVHSLVLVIGLVVGLSMIGNEMHGRYLVMIVPLLLVALGAGLSLLHSRPMRYGSIIVFTALFASNLLLAQNPAYQHDDARGMVQYYADTLTADDTVLAWSYADRYDLAYYWDRLAVPARRVTLPEGADLADIAPLLPDGGQVALNVWYTQRADFRGMLDCVLGNGTHTSPLEHTVYGMSNLLYADAPQGLPASRAFDRSILHNGVPVATITGIGVFDPAQADQALCAPVEIRLNQVIASDVQAAVVIRNSLGWDIAQTSAIFATANQRTTSTLAPGESATAYPPLRLPVGAPPGDYEILLRVFDSVAAPSGYDMVSESGNVIGKDLTLGTWHIRPGAAWRATNRETTLPDRVDLKVSNDLILLAHDIDASTTLTPGTEVRLQLLWQGRGSLPDLRLRSVTGDWQVTIPPTVSTRDSITLDWRESRIPTEVESGTAQLLLPDGTILADYQIDVLPRIEAVPDFAQAVDMPVGEIGRLIGYTPGSEAVDLVEMPLVTLVWQAGETTSKISYTVFVQLLDADGRLIAQSDSLPAQGGRPTTGWRSGEYVVDEHRLHFNENAAPGEARLIAGMYDAQTSQRLPVGPDGQDYIELPGLITVR